MENDLNIESIHQLTQTNQLSTETIGVQPSPTQKNAKDMIVRSMDDLKKEAPQVYEGMLQGLMSSFINRQRSYNERLHKLMRKM